MHMVETQLLGRDPELQTIEGLIGRSAEGGGALLIRGDAGLGKSALLARAIEVAQGRGLRILRALGVRTEANLPFAGLHQLLWPVQASIDELPGPQRLSLASAFGLEGGTADDPFL